MYTRHFVLAAAACLWLTVGAAVAQDRAPPAPARSTGPMTGFHAAHAQAISRRPALTDTSGWDFVGCAALPRAEMPQRVAQTVAPPRDKPRQSPAN